MTLRNAEIGCALRVGSVNLPKSTSRRLEMLGLTGNSIVTILNRKRNGAVIVNIRGTRFALGKEIAEGIEVSNG